LILDIVYIIALRSKGNKMEKRTKSTEITPNDAGANTTQ